MHWDKVASIVGIIAAIGTVWTRFVLLEARADVTDRALKDLTGEIHLLTEHVQALEVQLARQH